MARTARSYQREADQLRERGWTYRKIASHWCQRYGINSRVAFRLVHGMTQAEVAQRWNEQWPDADAPKTAKHISYWEIWPRPAGRAPSLDTLNKLAFLYRCAAGELLDGKDYGHLDSASPDTSSHGDDAGGALTTVTARDRQPTSGTVTRVTDAVIEDFEIRTDTYRHLDYREGSGRVSDDVRTHLHRMLEVSNRTTSAGPDLS